MNTEKLKAQTDSDLSILLATRSTTSAKLIGKQLRAIYNLLNADDAELAWTGLVEQREIALVICELELAINQFGLLERIRSAADNRLAAIPVLLLVGENAAAAQRELAFEKGATDFINLPFSSAELTARVRLHTTLYRQHSRAASLEMELVPAVNVLKQLAQENYFTSRVQQELSFSQRHRSHLSLGKLRLDNLREIMSRFDKATALSIVQAVAKSMQQTLRREDSLCYLGNAEFKVMFPATNGIGAIAGINRLLENVAQRNIRINGKQLRVTLSAAVFSCIAADDIDLEQIEIQLDSSLGRAVANGGNQVVSSTPAGEGRGMSIDRALKLITAGKQAELSPHLVALLQQVLPLLDFADETLQLDLETGRRNLRKKLGTVSKK
jgi:two-component system, cell cycle response regulator